MPVNTKHILLILLFLVTVPVSAQFRLTGILRTMDDSTAIAYASITIIETRQTASTDHDGRFEFTLPKQFRHLTIEITAIGIRRKQRINLHNGDHLIYLRLQENNLQDFVFHELKPLSIVRRAVALIPENYADRNHVIYSFYREYSSVNDQYCNLIESRLAVLFRLDKTEKLITSNEAFALLALRRSKITILENFLGHPIDDFFYTNPVYNLDAASLKPGLLDDYIYTMVSDTGSEYIISYKSHFSTERHGIRNWAIHIGESKEEGLLHIDKSSFAITRYERKAIRNPRYAYPLNDNFVLPRRIYYGEFCDAHLIVRYRKNSGRWYLDRKYYTYSNDFFSVASGTKEFTIRHYFEWFADSTSRYVTDDIRNNFYEKLSLPFMHFYSNRDDWNEVPDFFFVAPDVVLGKLPFQDLTEATPFRVTRP